VGILSFVRGFTCPEVQTRNPTQPRVSEKVKARVRVRVRVSRVTLEPPDK